MFTRDDIVFEEDSLARSHVCSQDEVKDALVKLINAFIIELGIKRLDKVIVKKTDFFDAELGVANYRNHTIVLANKIAYCLADKNARFYRRSLSILKHELYHFQDYQNLLLNLILKRIPKIDEEVLEKFRFWSEFFAAYSTFDVCEDEIVYSSFKSVYEKSFSTMDEKKYYACQLMGYYVHSNHNSACDELVYNYLSDKHIKQAVELFSSILKTYPYLSIEQLMSVEMILDELVVKKIEPPILTPVHRDDFFRELRQKSSND